MHAFVCESPVVERETILERDARGEVTTLLLHVDGDREAYEQAVEEVDEVLAWETTAAPNGFHAYVRTRLRPQEEEYRQALDRESVLVVTPVELRADRTVRQTMVGEADQLSAALEALPPTLSVEVLWTGRYRRGRTGGAGARLTDRQREAVAVARELGYYETPREASLSTVAAALDCSTSAASDLLRRAQRRLVAAAVDEDR